jgi:hypothetical protein
MNANLIEKGFGLATRTTKRFARTGAGALNAAGGLVGRARGGGDVQGPASAEPKDLDDVTLARKVETIIFRGRSGLKGSVDVNVANGVVELRGQVKRPEEVNALEAAARSIPEVLDVQSYLHTKGTPAPTRTDTPTRMRKPRTKAAAPRSPRPKLTDDRTSDIVAEAEEAPADKARARKGRSAAPMGSADVAGSKGAGTDKGETLPSGEPPLGQRPPAMEGEPVRQPKTEPDGTPVAPSGGRSSQSS